MRLVHLRIIFGYLSALSIIVFLSFAGYHFKLSLIKVKFVFSSLFILTLYSFSPSVIVYFSKNKFLLKYDVVLFLILITTYSFINFLNCFLLLFLFVTIWCIISINIIKVKKSIIYFSYFLFVMFLMANFIIYNYLYKYNIDSTLYPRFLLSSLIIFKTSIGFLLLNKKIYPALGVIAFLSFGQLIITLFDIFSFIF